jgi:hypothetical protein
VLAWGGKLMGWAGSLRCRIKIDVGWAELKTMDLINYITEFSSYSEV